jgi:signal transduction histidine kinase
VTSGTKTRAIEPTAATGRLSVVTVHPANRSMFEAEAEAEADVARATARLAALDEATRAIAGELGLDRVLQLMVDRVRGLVEARYAAIGIVDARGRIERFITSGISAERRARIGPLPRGRGLLGTIIREGVSVRIPEIRDHPDSYGFPRNHPPMRSFLGVPVRVAGKPIGNFYLTEKIGSHEFSARDQELVEMFAVHAGIAIQNARLHQRVQELAVVDERLRISRDLHDGIIQSIYAVGLSLEDVPELMAEDPAEATARIDGAIDRLHTTIRDIRAFIVDLAAPTDVTLAESIEAVVAEMPTAPGLSVEPDLADADAVEGRLSQEATHELLQIVREALSNIARHSEAAHAPLSLRVEGDELILRLEDDGRGFDPESRLGPGHLGLANLRNRAATIGGRVTIDSRPGEGTRIIVRLPLLQPESSTA